uniref:NADH dehydrogenase subunit 4 n=1 Tax=Nisia atrovenosa TaxID=1187023 RepID=UPI002A80E320|nr:NADH dehydrogenase subunit 4 [Nisia atrovenosa]WOW98926.1 NADH dehydrogenase subunit 4 [Nisia atrovenosa]
MNNYKNKMFFLFNFFFFFFFFLLFISFNLSIGFFCNIIFFFGFDIYSYLFCLLSVWIVILMNCSMKSFWLLKSFKYFNFLSCLILTFLILSFYVIDFFMFYLFFEISLIPVVLIIFGWGHQPERISSGFYLFFYTLFASLPLLVCIFLIISVEGCFNFYIFFYINNLFISFLLIFAFLVKFPMIFFHLWLPKAHVESPVGGSMILAGVMLKLGGYGLIRLLKFLIHFLLNFNWLFIGISLFSFFYLSLVCLIQSDLKVLVAYSSVCHMSMVISGIFSVGLFGVLGSLILMLGHGLVSSMLFFYIGILYNFFNSRSFFVIRGLLTISPSLSMMGFFGFMSNLSCPPSMNLISEILIISTLIMWSSGLIIFISLGLFFSAFYSILIFSFIHHGFPSSLIKPFNIKVFDYLIFFLHLYPIFIMSFNFIYFIYILFKKFLNKFLKY